MIINTAGEYTLQYTATDACGNSTTVERDLVVDGPPRTVLYTDGTFIINESSRDEADNIALHGVATDVYDPFDPNGDTDVKKYIFATRFDAPWNAKASSVKSVEIGSNISPTSTAYWFSYMTTCTSIDLTNLDTSSVVNMKNMFSDCRVITSLDLSSFNTSMVTNMGNMFGSCYAITSLDLSGFNTSSVVNMENMFTECRVITSLDLSSFDTSSVEKMGNMFGNCYAITSIILSSFDTSSVEYMNNMFLNCRVITSLDLSGFDTSMVTNMNSMFFGCKLLATIYASADFVVTQVTDSYNQFNGMSTNLVGGAGTVWSSNNPLDKTYAHIDGGASDPGYFTAKS